ncbi:MAG TPA: adenylate/guanylate cyclase domain-containing protein [Treponema sp.]|nr:adenylate/guanylate cyclase domain-containing protein [Treponema sp.]
MAVMSIGLLYPAAASSPKAVAGVLDLRAWDFEEDGLLSLEGEWSMYRKLLLDPAMLASFNLPDPLVQSLPGYWKIPDVLPAHSYASYVLTVLFPESLIDNNVILGSRCSDATSACKVWIDGQPLFSNGVVADNAQEEKPEFRPDIVFFTPKSSTVTVIIQVSNHNYRTGGVWSVPLLGTADQISGEWNRSMQAVLFLLGALIIMGINQVCLFFSRRKERSGLWFGIVCIIISMRIISTGDCLLNQWIPGFSWEIARKFEFLAICLGPVFFGLFIHDLFPQCMSRLVHRINCTIGFVFAAIVLLFPAGISSYLVIPMELYVAIVILWLLTILGIAFYRKERGSGWLLAGFIILALTVVNDILFSQLIVGSAYLLPIGFFAFIASQVVLLARKFTFGFNQSELFALELESTNKSFSRFVPTQFLQLLNREKIMDVELGDQIERNLTVLFSDIRQFTTLSEIMSPKESFMFLNTYLNRIGPKIREHGGFIDKYVGDGIMALFPESTKSAIDAAIAIQHELSLFNLDQRTKKQPEIEIGLGLHADVMALGTIGEQGRMDTTVIADAVNLASRLESLCKVYGPGIIVLEKLLDLLPEDVSYRHRRIGTVKIKGKKNGYSLVQIYEGIPASRSEKIDTNLELWNRAIDAYESDDLSTAYDLFEEVLEYDQEDLAANYLFIQISNELYPVL